jgi:hypothetical protein
VDDSSKSEHVLLLPVNACEVGGLTSHGSSKSEHVLSLRAKLLPVLHGRHSSWLGFGWLDESTQLLHLCYLADESQLYLLNNIDLLPKLFDLFDPVSSFANLTKY